ncbi:MAG: TlpA disulfide reductase family protein [Longimicrobiales bacterium]
MKKVAESMKRIVATLALSFILLPAAATHAQDVGLPVGTVAKPVRIEDLDGKPVDLAQYVGKKPVLLEFWATWCPICQALAPKLEAAAKKYRGKADVLVVAVAVNETPRSIKRHMAKHPMPGRVLWDVDGRATRAFMAPSTSYVVILDKKGRVVYTGTGEDQKFDAALARAMAAK